MSDGPSMCLKAVSIKLGIQWRGPDGGGCKLPSESACTNEVQERRGWGEWSAKEILQVVWAFDGAAGPPQLWAVQARS